MNQQDVLDDSPSGEGGFLYWKNRILLNNPTTDDTFLNSGNHPSEYPAGLALKALVEGYFFLNDKDDWGDVDKDLVIHTVKRGTNWLLKKSDTYAPANSENINYRAFAVWGLVCVYRLIQDVKYLNRAVEIFDSDILPFQDNDGIWYFNDHGVLYHDTTPYYAGIIIRALVDLFEVIPSEYDTDYSYEIREKLRNQIAAAINHFLNDSENNGGYGEDPAQQGQGQHGPRLRQDGRIWPYYRIVDHYGASCSSYYEASITPAYELIDGLYYACKTPNLFNSHDKDIIEQFLNVITRNIVDGVNNSPNALPNHPDVRMKTIAEYRHNLWYDDYDIYNNYKTGFIGYSRAGEGTSETDNMISIYRWASPWSLVSIETGYSNTGTSWSLGTTGDFDKDGEDEIAFYRNISDGRVQIYDPGFSYTGTNPANNLSFNTNISTYDLMASVDYDNDGFDEIVLCGNYYNYWISRYTIKIYKNGQVGQVKTNNYPSSERYKQFSQIASGDFDSDGKEEIAFYRRSNSNNLYIFESENLNVNGPYTINVNNFDMMARVDFDHDGFDELIFYRKSDHLISIYKVGATTPVHSANSNAYIYFDFDAMMTGDFDEDGQDEVAFYRKESNGRIQIYNPGIDDDGEYTGEKLNPPCSDGGFTINVDNFDIFLPVSFSDQQDWYAKSIASEKEKRPYTFALDQNYPNPFNPSTKIKFSLAKSVHVNIDIFNLIGQKVQTLLNSPLPAGNHEIEFNANNISSGIYFYIIEAGEFQDVKKMIFLK
jgi:hypothetical protein